MHSLIELFDKEVHIIAAPVATVAYAVAVLLILGIVRNGLSCSRIGIEIVVHVDSVNIIAGDDVASHLTDVVTILGDTRIQNRLPVILKAILGLTVLDMVGSQHCSGLSTCTIGIDPGVQLHTTGMALVNHPLKRVPVRLRRPTLLSCQETTPRLDTTFIERIALRTHLKDNEVNTVLLQLIKLVSQRLLHLLSAQVLELSVHTLNPCATHLTLRLCRSNGSHDDCK